METNTASIDIHLKKLLQRSITNMNARDSGKAIEVAVARIKRDISSRRGRRSKLRKTSLELKRRWMRQELGGEFIPRRQIYTATPWVEPPKVVIQDETLAIRYHNEDKSNPY